jgi:hypothetical protein
LSSRAQSRDLLFLLPPQNAADFYYHLPMRRILLCSALLPALTLSSISAQDASSSSSPKRASRPRDFALDSGTTLNGVYRNKTLALSCKIPAGWVLRTDEMNSPDEQPSADAKSTHPGAKVLLATFSRPPDARGQDVNSSILIAAELLSAYPGLKDAVQYFGPLTEVAKAQGFSLDEDPYEIALGSRNVVRADFHKDVGSRVMHQSTLALLSHGYAVSITLIAGSDDELEDLVGNLTLSVTSK